MPHKLGRRAPKRARAIPFARIMTGQIPPYPPAEDYLAKFPAWNMLGNDRAGDCVGVTWANFRRLVTGFLAEREVYPTQDQVWQVYRTQNPNFNPAGSPYGNGPGSSADQGMDIQTLLEYLVSHGGPDGVKAVAFAQVDTANVDEVKAAIAIFGGLWTGINVLAANNDQFSRGLPWDFVNSPVEGGHSVLTGGYGNAPGQSRALGGDEKFITWAAETSFTDAFWSHCVEEAWVVIWPEHLGTRSFQVGIDARALADAYLAITGKVLPIPIPPTPIPVPVPVPVVNPPTPTPTPNPSAKNQIVYDLDAHSIVAPAGWKYQAYPFSMLFPSQQTIYYERGWTVPNPNPKAFSPSSIMLLVGLLQKYGPMIPQIISDVQGIFSQGNPQFRHLANFGDGPGPVAPSSGYNRAPANVADKLGNHAFVVNGQPLIDEIGDPALSAAYKSIEDGILASAAADCVAFRTAKALDVLPFLSSGGINYELDEKTTPPTLVVVEALDPATIPAV